MSYVFEGTAYVGLSWSLRAYWKVLDFETEMIEMKRWNERYDVKIVRNILHFYVTNQM